jgi:hypothetical protein
MAPESAGKIGIMRFVFVNYSHPETAHISAVRVPTFARVLARRGHKVVLITLPKANSPVEQVPLADRLRAHNWREPFLLTWELQRSPAMIRWQAGLLPVWRRKILTVWWYLSRGGTRWDWTASGLPVVAELKTLWKADVVWGSFGQLDVVHLTQRIARLMECPWCLDIKDAWPSYTPSGLSGLLAWRYGDAAAFSVNSKFHLGVSMPFFHRPARVIYSGVDESLYAGPAPQSGTFDLVVIGSLYGAARFSGFVRGVTEWLESLSGAERGKIRLIYCGSDTTVAESVLATLRGLCKVELYSHLPLPEMVRFCRGAAANCYMWLPKGFHHKLIELLWCKRPILTFPGEHEESREIARQAGGQLLICTNSGQVKRELDAIWCGEREAVDALEAGLQSFTWERQADVLEIMLTELA